MILGSVLVVIGGLFLAFFNTTFLDLVVAAIPIFTGIIAMFISMINVVAVSSKPQETGIQTGMNQTFRNLGTAIRPVVASTILASFLATYTFGTPPFTVQRQAPSTEAFQLSSPSSRFSGSPRWYFPYSFAISDSTPTVRELNHQFTGLRRPS